MRRAAWSMWCTIRVCTTWVPHLCVPGGGPPGMQSITLLLTVACYSQSIREASQDSGRGLVRRERWEPGFPKFGNPGWRTADSSKKKRSRTSSDGGLHAGFRMGSHSSVSLAGVRQGAQRWESCMWSATWGPTFPWRGPAREAHTCRGSAWSPARGSVQANAVHARCRMDCSHLLSGVPLGRVMHASFCMYPCHYA